MRKAVVYFCYYLSRPFYYLIIWPMDKAMEYVLDYVYENDGPWGKKGSV